MKLTLLHFDAPILDRWAYEWMWMHGGWDVEPWEPPKSPPDSGVREPRRPQPPPDSMQAEPDA